MDTVTPEKRNEIMRAIRSVDTKPELFVRSVLHRAGYRYALHARDLPGSPDLALRSRRVAVEVRGCFWHLHEGCPKARIPETRHEWWQAKLRRNARRDARHAAELLGQGWRLLVVWECFLARGGPEARALQARILLARFERLLCSRTPFDILGEEDFLAGRRAARSPLYTPAESRELLFAAEPPAEYKC